MVDDELTSMYGHPPFRDNEGDVAIRVGSTMLFLRTSGDGKEVTVFAAVVHDVSGRSRATEVINDLNVESRWVKFQLVRDRVFASMSVLAQPFVPGPPAPGRPRRLRRRRRHRRGAGGQARRPHDVR